MSNKLGNEKILSPFEEKSSKKDYSLKVPFENLGNPYYENVNKRTVGNKLNHKKKKAIKRSIKNKNNIIFFLIIINLFSSNNQYRKLEINFSYITLKIKGKGNKKIFCDKFSLFQSKYYPNKIYINGELQNIVNHSYYFNRTENYVELLWNETIDNCRYMFYECFEIVEIDFSHFDTSQVNNMGYMFRDCYSLVSLNLSNFNTSKVTNMNYLFGGCSSLSHIDLSNFQTSLVSNMGGLFFGCSTITELNLSNFNTINVTNMDSMFCGCSSLLSLNLSNFGTSKVSRMESIFCNCSSLTSLNLSNFNISLVKYMRCMFKGCIKLEYINLENFKENNDIRTSNNIFDQVPHNIVVCIKENNNNKQIFPQLKEKRKKKN